MFSYVTADGVYPVGYRMLTDKQAKRTISLITKRKFGWIAETDSSGSIIQLIYTNSKNESVRQNLMHCSGYPEKWYAVTRCQNGKWIKGLLAE